MQGSVTMSKKRFIIHPYKFNMWLFLMTLIMVFGGLTSAYIVSNSFVPEANRIVFDVPGILWQNLLVILFSSITMQFSVWAIKRDESKKAMLGLIFTLILGIVFLIGQFSAWQILTDSGLTFVDPRRMDNSISFFYIFTGLHGIHIVAAIILVLVTLVRTSLDSFKLSKLLNYEITATFWHFLGLLWIYLFAFIMYTQQLG